MSFQLVIAEKPSVACSIATVIGADEKQNGYWQGGGYLVSWCIGHLVSFAEAGQYDEKYCKWRYEDLPILPQPWQFIVPDEKKPQFEIVRALLNRPDVDSVTAATDAGREGELIFRFVYQMAGCTKPVKRLWISSMEDAAIREGFANLRPDSDYDALYQSALCRAKADWLVGINATRLFSVLYHKTLTVGRVQTPTLKMLVDRDAKILRFQKEKYYTVGIHSGSLKADSGRIADVEAANSLKEKCTDTTAVCTSVKREKKTEQPPKLYDLTTLQREANRLFGFTAKQTLDYAQQLYEKKLLTYPRTDSQWKSWTNRAIFPLWSRRLPPLCERDRTFRRNRRPITTLLWPMCRTAARCSTKASITCRNRPSWPTSTRACRITRHRCRCRPRSRRKRRPPE